MTSFHFCQAFDKFYDALIPLLTDGDTFSADLFTDTDFDERFTNISAALKEACFATTKQKKTIFLNNLFAAKKASTWFILENFKAYVDIWTAAISDGFLPDCVCHTGPSPSVAWTKSASTPKKGVTQRPDPDTFAALPGSFNTAPPEVPLVATHPALPLGQPLVTPIPGNDSAAALQAFLLGGGTGIPLPTSPDPGKTTASTLPFLSVSASPLVAPSGQPVYDLEKFVTGYVTPSTLLVLQANGTFTAPKSARTINSPANWIAAAHSFGLAMANAADAHQFNWPDFIVFIDTISILFKHYVFEAVVSYEMEWRRWRRAYSHSWTASNLLLRDAFLLGKNIPVAPLVVPAAKARPAAGATLICHDFSRPTGCSRPACKYPHKCKRCQTTFPSSSSNCPCILGVLPPGAVLPPGVTFGQ